MERDLQNGNADCVILGSGFGGSLLALILARSGLVVVLVDCSRHPRFAIGESSTPLADRTLAVLAERYQLAELLPLCHWGSWKRELPDLICGRKRGFTYFDQTQGDATLVGDFSTARLLVSASEDDENSDTHWLRSDVDHFVFRLAEASGVITFQECAYDLRESGEDWCLDLHADGRRIRSPFVVDATGSSRGILKLLGVEDQTHLLRTNSRSVFAHFSNVSTCEDLLQAAGTDQSQFPYPCDDAAVHQVVPDGWMWQLRFDDNSLSAGFMIDGRSGQSPGAQESLSAAEEWEWRIQRTPFLRRQFANGRIIRPESGLQKTGRIQRLSARAAGSNWAALAHTAGFIDPLHSTGIAHTLFSVARLAEILLSTPSGSLRTDALHDYSETLISELRCIDELVEGCYEAIPSFRMWCLWGMLYFAAATSMEQASDQSFSGLSFLRANDAEFRRMLRQSRCELHTARRCDPAEPSTVREAVVDSFEVWLTAAIAPWNQTGLFDPNCRNLYSSTASPRHHPITSVRPGRWEL